MRKRISTLMIAVVALAAFGGTASVATAKHGADDPAGHVRQSGGADDPVGHVRHSGTDDSRARPARRGHRRERHGRGHDRPGHGRRGHGADDGPNHS